MAGGESPGGKNTPGVLPGPGSEGALCPGGIGSG